MKFRMRLLSSAVLIVALAACGGGGDDDDDAEATPSSLSLSLLGRYSSGQFDAAAAEITAFDAASRRGFVVNAQAGTLDVLDLRDPSTPVLLDAIDVSDIAAGATVNSVAVAGGVIAVAIQAAVKTDPGFVGFYRAADLSAIDSVPVGALPDMLVFTPDGKQVLVANEGEPSDDYQTDPEGSISIIDVSDLDDITVRTAGFAAFSAQAAALRVQGVRVFGPNANVAQDFEPEYIAVASDSKTAWAVLQENNALARIDIATATVTEIVPLGFKDHGLADNAFGSGNALDTSDEEGGATNLRTWAGLRGLYLPDAIAAYQAGGQTYLITANEGDARAWGEDNPAYWAGNASLGFVEEFRMKHLVNANGFAGRAGDDLPPQLSTLAAGALLNPATFAYCGATAGDPGACRDDEQLGRLNVTWTLGYRTDTSGAPVLFDASGAENPAGDRLMYDTLYSFGARSFSIWNDEGELVWDSGDEIERFLASDECLAGAARNIACRDFFNSGHDEGDALDSRSDAKGPEPEGLTIGRIGEKTFLFLGLERMGGVLVYDITDPRAPVRIDYINTREDWTTDDPSTVLATVGDLGPEGLAFIAAENSPTGEPLLMVGNEVSGTTAIYRVELTF